MVRQICAIMKGYAEGSVIKSPQMKNVTLHLMN